MGAGRYRPTGGKLDRRASKSRDHVRCERIAARFGQRGAQIVHHFEEFLGRAAAFNLELNEVAFMCRQKVANDFIHRGVQTIEARLRIAQFAMCRVFERDGLWVGSLRR